MTIACHQPNYLPWIGYFYKLKSCDVFVILDSVQFPKGRSWITRNRIKTPAGNVMLSVPVRKKGQGIQQIRNIEIDNTFNWRRKHLLSILHFYKKAPYFHDYIDSLKQVYAKNWVKLVDLNIEIIRKLNEWTGINTKIVLSSELKVEGRKTELLINICKQLNVDTYISGSGGQKYIDENMFENENINVRYCHFVQYQYPQLWGNFIGNLSMLDLLFNCGKKGFEAQILLQKKENKRCSVLYA